MDILERYLQAVAEHLPAKNRQDTVAELRANLLAEMEGREEELGRPLTEDEAAKILEAHGRPIMVAARYRPQHALIGTAMFPLYWHTLKKSFPLLVLAYAAVEGVRVFLQGQPLSELTGALLRFWSVGLIYWAIVTLGFAIFEYLQQTSTVNFDLGRWSARELPKLQPAEKGPSRMHDIADAIASIGGILWLLYLPNHLYLIFGPGAKYIHGMPFVLMPDWRAFYWQIIELLAVMAVVKTVMLVGTLRPWRAWLKLGVQMLGIGIPAIMLQAKPMFVPAAGSSETLQSLAPINEGVMLGLKIAILVAAAKLLWDLWQLVRSRVTNQAGCAAVW